MATAARERAQTMQAAVLAAAQSVELQPVARPEPGPGQVRVRIEGSGVCGSDIPVWEGRDWFEYPREPGAPGHEGWGVIDAVGESVDGLEEGMRVASLGSHAYAQYDVVDAGAVIPLPHALDGRPFPGEPLGCAVNVFRRSGIDGGQRVALVGAGFLGCVVVALAARAGADVVAISRRESALRSAEAMGAVSALSIDDELPGEFDCVIEAAGTQRTLDIASSLVKTRGRLVVAGFHQDGPRTVDMQSWNWRGIDVINAHERDPAVYVEGVQIAADLVARGELDPAPLLTHEFPLERLGDAFRAAVARPDGFMKALVRA